jgi:hypothetical protein
LSEFDKFLETVPFRDYTKETFKDRIFQDVEDYKLKQVEININEDTSKYRASANIWWSPLKKDRSPISLYFFL